MDEDRYFVIGFLPFRIAHDDANKQTAIDTVADHLVMIVERPAASGLLSRLEFVDPDVAGADFIGAPAHPTRHTERPRAISPHHPAPPHRRATSHLPPHHT